MTIVTTRTILIDFTYELETVLMILIFASKYAIFSLHIYTEYYALHCGKC